ncbi:MAG: thiol-disulfide oxidoreductase DCC family protein, partial [Bryobacteraceae bacterium]
MDDCLRELHVVDPAGRVRAGWPAVAALARLFAPTWLIGAIGAVPPFSWLGVALYRWVARNRYAVSRCRGGVCRSATPAEVRRRSSMGAFWSCRFTG